MKINFIIIEKNKHTYSHCISLQYNEKKSNNDFCNLFYYLLQDFNIFIMYSFSYLAIKQCINFVWYFK